jgi:single-stranded-DNA-specific exonuclease
VGEKATQWLDLVAMATVADQMPLLGVNRALVVHGLPLLQQGIRPGLKALLATTNIEAKNLTAEQLSFSLIPRLNAMGRLADGVESLRLLCIQSPQRAAELAQKLQETNVARQDLTHDLLAVAMAQAEEQTDQKILVVASAEFHEGVIGLLAGKLLEKYTKPVVAIHIGATLAKASVRSLPGVNIIELLRQMKSAFWELGGHALAAGFACDPEKIAAVRAQLIQLAAVNVRPEQLEPVLTADCQLTGEWLSLDLLDTLAKFQPFGQANPKPSFHFTHVTIGEISVVGKSQQHLRLGLQFPMGEKIIAMAWQKAGRAPDLKLGQKIELVATVEANVWRERRQVQLIASDWK